MVEDLTGTRLLGLLEPASTDSSNSGSDGNTRGEGTSVPLRLFISVEQEAIRAKNVDAMRLACCLLDEEQDRGEEEFEGRWNGYLRLYNLFQFLPYAFFVTRQGVAANLYEGIRFGKEPATGPSEEQEVPRDAWEELREQTDDALHGLLRRLVDADWPVPEAGYELVDSGGAIVASAELAWDGVKIAFLLDEEMVYSDVFAQEGWRIWRLSEVVADPEEHLSSIRW
jgi:DEAD/DEAH box helicase domain-containing protein